MFARLSKLREERAQGDKGFTLIELLVVVVILGILIAIAIPLYLNYRKGANDAAAKSDLRNAINVLEQCNTDNTGYPASLTAVGNPVTSYTACTGQTINVSAGTTVAYYPSATSPYTAYLMTATNSSGATKTYCYASSAGGAVKQSTTVQTAYATACT